MKNIEELNVIAGEGIAAVRRVQGAARLQMPDSVPLQLFKNGLMMFNGPFRPYTDETAQVPRFREEEGKNTWSECDRIWFISSPKIFNLTPCNAGHHATPPSYKYNIYTYIYIYINVNTIQSCIRDLMEGYFPWELKERYPDGVPFKLIDRRLDRVIHSLPLFWKKKKINADQS